ncbi:MAG TPA: hypothetical protein VGI86_13505 [Acidimicrobiia bacterium]
MVHRSHRLGVAITTVIAAFLVLFASAAAGAAAITVHSAAPQAATSRAGVIVDEGNGTVKHVGITFTGTISGLAALQKAGFSPTVRSFGGIGGAVCAIDVGGTSFGCPADGTCLTCAEPDYWDYSQAAAGTTQLTSSRAGAGITKVSDGDVEGWRWGTGATPTYKPISSFFPPPTTTTIAAPPTSAPRVSTQGTPPPPTVRHTQPAPSVNGGPTTTGPRSTTTTAGTKKAGTKKPTATTTTTKHGSPTTAAATDLGAPNSRAGPSGSTRRLASAPPTVHTSSGSSPVVWIVFAVIIAAFAVAIVTAHYRRARTAGE